MSETERGLSDEYGIETTYMSIAKLQEQTILLDLPNHSGVYISLATARLLVAELEEIVGAVETCSFRKPTRPRPCPEMDLDEAHWCGACLKAKYP